MMKHENKNIVVGVKKGRIKGKTTVELNAKGDVYALNGEPMETPMSLDQFFRIRRADISHEMKQSLRDRCLELRDHYIKRRTEHEPNIAWVKQVKKEARDNETDPLYIGI